MLAPWCGEIRLGIGRSRDSCLPKAVFEPGSPASGVVDRTMTARLKLSPDLAQWRPGPLAGPGPGRASRRRAGTEAGHRWPRPRPGPRPQWREGPGRRPRASRQAGMQSAVTRFPEWPSARPDFRPGSCGRRRAASGPLARFAKLGLLLLRLGLPRPVTCSTARRKVRRRRPRLQRPINHGATDCNERLRQGAA